jgi:hypothetical protein
MTIMKQLVEQMIGEYLNESYENDLVESIFEEVSEETWEAIEEAILNELSEQTRDLYIEGSLKKGSPERAIKDAFRKGEAKTRDFYSGDSTARKFKAPKTPQEKFAYKSGERAGDGSPTAIGAKRSVSQDSLAGTAHDQSNVTPTSKSFRSTHARKSYAIGKSKSSPTGETYKTSREKADLTKLSADNFEKKYRMTKAEWERKNNY